MSNGKSRRQNSDLSQRQSGLAGRCGLESGDADRSVALPPEVEQVTHRLMARWALRILIQNRTLRKPQTQDRERRSDDGLPG